MAEEIKGKAAAAGEAAEQRLRQLADAGALAYPYSTRELCRVARHVDAFPSDPVSVALEDVLAADAHDAARDWPEIRPRLSRVGIRRVAVPRQ